MSSIEEIEKSAKESGNNFHHQVLKRLKDEGCFVQISPYYNDFVSEKPREIDLLAEKTFKVYESSFLREQVKGLINVRLYIECKYIPESVEIVFWFYERDKFKVEELVTKDTGLSAGNSYSRKHHYLKNSDKVVKLINHKVKTTRGEDKEIFYKALNQSLNATISLRGKKSIIPNAYLGAQKMIKTIHYPVIVCNSFENFYKMNMDVEGTPSNIKDNFQLEVNYTFIDKDRNQKDEYFLIDVVAIEKLNEFLFSLNDDISAIKVMLEKP
jgi:hypothetical protein